MKHAGIDNFRAAGIQRQLTFSRRTGGGASRNLLCGSLLSLLILVPAGCRTHDPNSHSASLPEPYCHLAILPICIDGSFSADYRATPVASEASRHQIGTQLAFALTNQLARKGYQVVGPVRVLCDENDWCELDLAVSGVLRQQFDLERIRADCGETNALHACGFVSSLRLLQEKPGPPEVDAVVLVERWLDSAPPVKPMPRAAKNGALTMLGILAVAGGDPELLGRVLEAGKRDEVLFGPYTQPVASIGYSLYVFDSRTHEIIYHRYRPHSSENPRRAVRALLGPLPKVGE